MHPHCISAAGLDFVAKLFPTLSLEMRLFYHQSALFSSVRNELGHTFERVDSSHRAGCGVRYCRVMLRISLPSVVMHLTCQPFNQSLHRDLRSQL